MATIFSKQELQDFETLRQQMGDTAILDEVAKRNPAKKQILDSLRQGGVDDAEIANEFLKRKSTWKLPETQWHGMSPQVQKNYQQNYNIQIVPAQKPQAEPTQPQEQGLGAKILGIGKAIERPGIEASQKLRAGYLKATGVIPSVTKLENKVFVEKDRAWLNDMASKGKIPPESDIISKFGEERGGKLVAEIRRLSPKLFKPEATRRARGEMGTQTATSTLGIVGEEVMNAIEQLASPEQVLQPSQLALNLAGIGIGGKVATLTMDNAIKQGLTEAVRAKTMSADTAKQTFKAYKYYSQNTSAETLQAILRGDIPAPKVPGMLKEGEVIGRKPKPVVPTEQRAGIEYAPTGEELRQGTQPTPTTTRGAIPTERAEPITELGGLRQVQPLERKPIEPSGKTPAQLRAEQEAQFAEVFPDLAEKPIETLPEQRVEIPKAEEAIPQVRPAPPTPEPATPQVEGGAPKEAWQMTREEFKKGTRLGIKDMETGKIYPINTANERIHADMLERVKNAGVKYENIDAGFIAPNGEWISRWTGRREKDGTFGAPKFFKEGIEGAHEYAIQQAIKEGKQVPPEVLADYPDLAKTVQKEPTKPLSAEERVKASGKELTPQAVVDEMTPDELAEVVSTPIDEYIHQDLSPEAYAVFTHKVRKEGFESPSVTDRNIEDYLGKVKKMILDYEGNSTIYRDIYEDVFADPPRYAEAQREIDRILGIEHDVGLARVGKMGKATRTIFDETVHRYATRKAKATPEPTPTVEPKAETPIPEEPKVSAEEANASLEPLMTREEVPPPEGMTDAEIAEIEKRVGGKKATPKTPPEDLIKAYMDGYKLSRQDAIQKILDSGSWETEGKPVNPSLAQNPIKANDDVINKYAEGISMEAEKGKFGIGKVWQSFQTLYNWTVHRYQPIAQITNFAQKGGVVPEGENPLLLAKRYSGVEKIASEKIFKETRRRNPDGSSTVTGEGLAQVLRPVQQDIKDFGAYLAAERDIELAERGIKGSPNQADAPEAIRAIQNKYGTAFKTFQDTAQAFRDWTKRAMLDELKEIGFLSQKAYDKTLESNRFYAPFQRVMEIMERRGVIPSSKEAFTPQGKPIHKIVGSERQVIDPLENAITNVYKITDFIERQRVANATINLRNIDPRLEQVITKGRGKYEIPVYENGVRQLYNVPKDLHTALKGMDEADMGTLMRIVSFPTRTLRAGATLIPEFWFRNPLRDQLTAFVNAKYGFYPGYDFIKGIFHTLKKDDLYNEWLASGADHSMFVSLDRMTARATLKDVLRGRPKYWSPKHPIEAVRALSELFERGTRVGVYGRARSGGDILYKALHKGESPATELEAAFEAREATTDFARRGSQTKAVNQLIAFWNANIQGVDKMVRSFKDRPLESSIKAISSITIPSITLYLLNKDNPRYKELPQWEKDFFWIIIPSDESPIIRVPKPFELGILFGTSAEHLIDYIGSKDPEAVKDLANSAWQALTPGMIPTGLQPYIEAKTDKNLFTNRPIVPQSLAKLPPEMQYEPYSSETAKAVGTWIKYSPLKIDNAIRGYFGGMGKWATDGVDEIVKRFGAPRPPAPSKTPADLPLIRGFVAREPIGSVSESVNDFYKAYQKIQEANNAIKQFQKEKDAKKAIEYMRKHPEAKFMSGFTTVVFSMAKARRAIQAIYDDKNMTPAKKRKAIDELNMLITKQAELALTVYNNAKKGESEKAEQAKSTEAPTRKYEGQVIGLDIPYQP